MSPFIPALPLALASAILAADPDATLMRLDGPVTAGSFTSVDTEPRFAIDRDIDTVWSPGKGAILRLDLGGETAIGGWRIAAVVSTPVTWTGREPSKEAPGYEVLASGDGRTWRRIAKPVRGDGRIGSGQRVELRLAQPASARWLEIRLGDLGGLMDLEILGADGSEVPACARARAGSALRTRLRSLGWSARYAAKAASWCRDRGLQPATADASLGPAIEALDRAIATADAADAPRIASWQAEADRLGDLVAAAVSDADGWCDLLLRADLAATAGHRAAAMGDAAAAAAAAAMAGLAADRDRSRQAEFERQRAAVDAAWSAWTAGNRAVVTRDGRWYVRADGRRIVPFGLNYVQIGLLPSLANPSLIRRTTPVMNEPTEREFRNLRLWGFNAVRLALRLDRLDLDMRTGEYRQAYLDRIREVLGWANRYDIHAIIDLHLDYGTPPMAPSSGPAYIQNHVAMLPYYAAAWRIIAGACRDQSNVIAYELIANEPNIALGLAAALRERHTDPWHDTAGPIDAWHAHLTARHGSLEGAAAFWSATGRNPAENATLRLAEAGAVADPVALAKRFPDLDAEANTRLRDYLLAAQDIYQRQCETMAAAIRQADPGHLLAFSVNYDLRRAGGAGNRPFGADCSLLYDLRPAGMAGITDHYNGLEMARRFRATGQPWFAGENWIFDGSTAEFARILAAGGGNIGWAHWPSDHHFEGAIGHDLWMKDQWRCWSAAAWFSDNLRSGEVPGAEVALIAPLMAYDQSVARLPRLLERIDVRHDVLIDEAVARDPSILSRYRAVVLDLDRTSLAAVRAVLASPVPALCANRQTADGDNRWGTGSAAALAGTFYRAGRLPPPPPAANDPQPLSLAGTWHFRTDPQGAGDAAGWQALTAFADWDRLPAPGYWETETISQGRYATYDGVAWYAREFALPDALAGRDLVFSAVIDDIDTVWVNGERIGSTDHTTLNWWIAPRRYRIPAALVHRDRPNVLVIRVTDEKNRGGIVPGALQLGVEDREDRRLEWTASYGGITAGTAQEIAVSREMPRIADADLADGCTAVARFADGSVAAARAGRHLLWLGGDGITFGADTAHPATEERILAAHLQSAGVAMTWPPTPASDQLDVTHLDGFTLVENRSARPCLVDPAGLVPGRAVSWVRLVAPPYREREADGPVEIPPGAFAGVVWRPSSDR